MVRFEARVIGIGSWSGVDRVKWEISEKTLFARHTTRTRAPTTRGPATATRMDSVAAYSIESHFDIRRAYNPQTGEELNVIEENTTDRPWNERQYMRVDWSVNEVDNPMWEDMFVGKVFGKITVNSLAYAASDPRSDDAPHFEINDGYFDITSSSSSSRFRQSREDGIRPSIPPAPFGLFTGSAMYNCDAQGAIAKLVSASIKSTPMRLRTVPSELNPRHHQSRGLGTGFTADILTPTGSSTRATAMSTRIYRAR